MKRPNRSDLAVGYESGPLISTPKTEEKAVFMEEEGEEEEDTVGAVSGGEKKRRLGVEQVKALEKNFDVDNKLEPERKLKLAKDLGLQPRQVAVWFQNRRARWKTKQLERDFVLLKADYDNLKLDHDSLSLQHDALLAEINELKAKLAGKEEDGHQHHLDQKKMTQEGVVKEEEQEEETPPLLYKDVSSDSDTSVILNGENSPNHSAGGTLSHGYLMPQQQEPKQPLFTMGVDCSYPQQPQEELLAMEEQEFLVDEEPCSSSLFSDEQAPTLDWYCDQWR